MGYGRVVVPAHGGRGSVDVVVRIMWKAGLACFVEIARHPKDVDICQTRFYFTLIRLEEIPRRSKVSVTLLSFVVCLTMLR